MLPGAELLIDPPLISRAAGWLAALAQANPAAKVTPAYRGKHRLLVLYGAGLPSRLRALREHVQRGGRVATWDIGYWSRDDTMRLSIDALHPLPDHLAACDGLTPRARPSIISPAAFDPAGPILLIGLGPKSCTALDLAPYDWERRRAADLRQRFPGRLILHRPKPGQPYEPIEGTRRAPSAPIDGALRGCSLVVCRHSNVAIDACIAGVPVECEDGAAFALYRNGSQPDENARREFLGRLAWWNWARHEAAEAWRFMEGMTCA
jgi:hypothetical protein